MNFKMKLKILTCKLENGSEGQRSRKWEGFWDSDVYGVP